MCDRILVFGSNPGRILSEINATLPQPRQAPGPELSRTGGKDLRRDDFPAVTVSAKFAAPVLLAA